jgi:lipopolysaccharide transport system ATP-binding protein
VRVVGEDGTTVATADVRRPIGVEIVFRVLRSGQPVFPKIKMHDRQGDIAFNAMDTSPRWDDPSEPGEYAATAWIPGNSLNEGPASVDVAVCSLSAPKLLQHAAAYRAVSFQVYDPGDGDSARGRFTGELRGVVRPLLEWTTEKTD